MLLYGLTVLVSAFLLFQVQPVIAKIILPWFGGSAAVWTTCLLFFQMVLLLGYPYAHAAAPPPPPPPQPRRPPHLPRRFLEALRRRGAHLRHPPPPGRLRGPAVFPALH